MVKIDEGSHTEIFVFPLPRKYIFRYFKYKIQKNIIIHVKGTCHLFNMCIWSPMGAQEQGPKGKNPNFKTLSSLDVEVVQPNHSVYRCIFRSRITVVHA